MVTVRCLLSFAVMKNNFFLLAALIFAFTGCSSLKPLEYRSLENFGVSQSGGNPQLSFDLKLFNPNVVGAKLKDFNVSFDINGTKLADVHLDEVTHAGAQSEFTIPMNVSTSLSQLAQFLPSGLDLFNSGKSIPVTINGSVTVKKFIFHKTFPFNVHEAIDTKKIRLGN